MKCESIQEKLPLYIENDLPQGEMDSIAEHLKSCEKCQAELEVYEKTWQALDSWKDIEPSANFLPGFWEKAEKPGLLDRFLSLFTIRTPAWATLALILIGIFVGSALAPEKVVQQPPKIVYVEVTQDFLSDAKIEEVPGKVETILPRVSDIIGASDEDFEKFEPEEIQKLAPIEDLGEPGGMERLDVEEIFGI